MGKHQKGRIVVTNTSRDSAESSLAQEIRGLDPNTVKREKLSVDDRVLARVTDGIYRQPASAIRELISNAYDADATRVTVRSDAPRFERIVIEDNGQGMSPEVLAYLFNHIGGSSKRTQRGKSLGTVATDDVLVSKSGRRLIGKIGIGMFAVSQLTQHFQIITKQKHDKFYTSAIVTLETHSESRLADEDGTFKTGEVLISRVPTDDISAHGTTIVLMNLRKSVKDELGSVARWQAVDDEKNEKTTTQEQFNSTVDNILWNSQAPVFHVGRLSSYDATAEFSLLPHLPWDDLDNPKVRFTKLYNAINEEVGRATANPTVGSVLDNYLKMLWDISLSVPVDYIDKHPFAVEANEGIGLYQISNSKKRTEQSTQIDIAQGSTIADFLQMEACGPDPAGGFRVFFDDIELLHPIKIDPVLRGESKHTHPLLFVGKFITPFANIPPERGGGPLEFEAYIYWNQTIVPKENNGVLIRVNKASGTLFDETFLDYRVSELTRLKQMMVEIYVHKGLDPALNIDRESFNRSHPHYQFIKEWLHRAIRQATNRLKNMNKETLRARKEEVHSAQRTTLSNHVEAVWKKLHRDDAFPPSVELVEEVDLAAQAERRHGKLVLRHVVAPPSSSASTHERACLIDRQTTRIKSLASVLAAYGLADCLPYDRLEELIRDIDAIYQFGGN